MISVEEAKQLIRLNTPCLSPVNMSIDNSCRRTLAIDIVSPVSLPGFNQSAMDGYGVFLDSHLENSAEVFSVVGESAAGNYYKGKLSQGEAIRIFTGALVPDCVNTVVPLEETAFSGQDLIKLLGAWNKGANIRLTGTQIKKGEVAIRKGEVLTPAAIGFLASMGILKVEVYRKPKIKIVITGSELVEPGKALNKDGVYESNSFMLRAVLKSMGVDTAASVVLPDNMDEIKSILANSLLTSDLVLITGGISVGKYDFVGNALKENGVEPLFYKIRQKPGKPLYLGKKNQTIVFALPGNPAAALTCFYEYVYESVLLMQGRNKGQLLKTKHKVVSPYSKKAGLAHFLKAELGEEGVKILNDQESNKLNSFSNSNCLVYLPEQKEAIAAGELVEVHFLPFT